MTGVRRVAVFTGTRAEYGLLQWIMADLRDAPDLELQVIVTGAHLSPYHGHTLDHLLADGFTPDAVVEMLLSSDTAVGTSKSTGLALMGVAEALDRLSPDVLVLLGDRTEVLAAASAALIARVPVVHLHGGEVTTGAIDESIRHAVTKLSAVHLVAAEPYAKRVRQLGEDPSRVHVVGAPGLDHLSRGRLLSRQEPEDDLGTTLPAPLALMTYHPVTTADVPPVEGLRAVTDALDALPDLTVVVTLPNADPGGAALREALLHWSEGRPRTHAWSSLGHRRYLSLLAIADVVVGNSSSSIIEAPSVGTPTVNVGPRQDGRLRATSIHDVGAEPAAVRTALEEALSADGQARALATVNPYGAAGDVSPRVLEVLRAIDPAGLAVKRFHDVATAGQPV